MKKILVISLFGGLTLSYSRLKNIITYLEGDEVTVLTSDFSHGSKTYKNPAEIDSNSKIKEVRLHVPPYKRNLSVKRIVSHISFAKAVKHYLQRITAKPDIVYCTMPASSPAYVAGKWCKRNHIPFIIDVIDIWPDSLIPIIPMKKALNVLLYPWYRLSQKSYEMADYISAESQEYMEIAKKYNTHAPSSYTYLGVDHISIQDLILSSKVRLKKPDDEIWLCYGGSLGQSYDFDSILNATAYIHNKGIKYHLWFVGDGEKRGYIENKIHLFGLHGTVTGLLNYPDFLKYLSLCNIAFNSFNPNTLVVHSYKFNDYVATGCYIMNSLKGETADLIDKYNIGINYTTGTIGKQLYEVCQNWNQISSALPARIATVIDNYLDKNKIYRRLADDIKRNLDHSVEIPK